MRRGIKGMSELGVFMTWLGTGAVTLGGAYVAALASARTRGAALIDGAVVSNGHRSTVRDGHSE